MVTGLSFKTRKEGMISDSAFYIGKTHHICQDFSGQGIRTCHCCGVGMPFVVISDGCSSSPDTDFGARFLVKSCINLLNNSPFFDEEKVLREAYSLTHQLKLHEHSLDATLCLAEGFDLSASAPGEGNYGMVCIGDGVLAKIRRSGEIEVSEITYDSGAPYYLSYRLDPERDAGYKNTFGLKRSIKRYTIAEGIQKNVSISVDEDGSCYVDRGTSKDYVAIAVMSDGVLSFQKTIATSTSKVNVPVESYKVLNELLSFKNYNGVFVQRRFQRFRKDCEALGWFSLDDVSIGAIHLGD